MTYPVINKIVLASASPQRSAILKNLGLNFEVFPSNADEKSVLNTEARALTLELSRLKAREVSQRCVCEEGTLIVSADTVVESGGYIIGKPGSDEEARLTLTLLSGSCHRVVSGVTLLSPSSGKCISRTCETSVYFRDLQAEEIEYYIKSGEHRGKAGSYAIQGLGSLFVEKIEGDYFNIVGFPVCMFGEMLIEGFGVTVGELRETL